MSGDIFGNGSKVILPFNKDQFAGFISSLLGRPQKIEQRFAFPFEIKTEDVSDTFHLVEQRVHDQNRANLIQFSVDVSYNDGSSVTHSCLADFQNYKEVKPLVPSSITLSWTYLITFQGREAPEKQEIEITFITHASHYSPEYSYKELDRWFSHAVGVCFLKINHTSRSWGGDMESLLANHLQTFQKTESKFRKWCRKNSSKTSVLFFLSIFSLGLIGLLTTTYLMTESEHAAVGKLMAAESNSTIEDKIDFLIQHSLLGNWPRYFFSAFVFVVVLIVGGIFGSAAISNISEKKEPSFILISKTSIKHKEDILLKLCNSWKKHVWVLVGGITTGVVSNIVFTLVWLP